jgi:hypothetical protein
VFNPGRPFQHSVMFASKARASLLQTFVNSFVNNGCKKLYKIGPRSPCQEDLSTIIRSGWCLLVYFEALFEYEDSKISANLIVEQVVIGTAT